MSHTTHSAHEAMVVSRETESAPRSARTRFRSGHAVRDRVYNSITLGRVPGMYHVRSASGSAPLSSCRLHSSPAPYRALASPPCIHRMIRFSVCVACSVRGPRPAAGTYPWAWPCASLQCTYTMLNAPGNVVTTVPIFSLDLAGEGISGRLLACLGAAGLATFLR